ncbi:MAG: family 16 glycoside hydrolase [Hyphomicrobiales bacterium]
MAKCILAAVVFAVLVCGFAAAQTPEKAWSFDSDKAGDIPESLNVIVGEWRIVADPDAPSKPNVLAQVAKNSGATFNLVLAGGTNYKNIDMSVKMRAVSGSEDQGGGLVWRAQGPQNYYIARYNPLEDNYRIYKVDRGRRIQLQSADVKRTEGWHTLRVTMAGDHIQCYYDGLRYLDVKDSTFQEPGKIGLWTKADAQSHFDDWRAAGD